MRHPTDATRHHQLVDATLNADHHTASAERSRFRSPTHKIRTAACGRLSAGATSALVVVLAEERLGGGDGYGCSSRPSAWRCLLCPFEHLAPTATLDYGWCVEVH